MICHGNVKRWRSRCAYRLVSIDGQLNADKKSFSATPRGLGRQAAASFLGAAVIGASRIRRRNSCVSRITTAISMVCVLDPEISPSCAGLRRAADPFAAARRGNAAGCVYGISPGLLGFHKAEIDIVVFDDASGVSKLILAETVVDLAHAAAGKTIFFNKQLNKALFCLC